jgi:carbamoyltransferase
MMSDRFATLVGIPRRQTEDAPLEQVHMDIAASVQAVAEEAVLRMVRDLRRTYGIRNLCLAGGVALNCVANGRILRECGLDGLWIQPAAGDAGAALGAALAAWHQHNDAPRPAAGGTDAMQGAYLGPGYRPSDVTDRLRAAGAVLDVLDEPALLARTVAALAGGKTVGWFQGRMEFGPRALGARSILADARSPAMQRILNLKVKNRENFRPFAPVVLEEDAAAWFELDGPSPYMLLTARVRPEHCLDTPDDSGGGILQRLNRVRSSIPAVTHVDFSARVQTVNSTTNPRLHRLLTMFKAATDCPVLVNTSFNVRSEPIVCTPEDAFRCFMGTEIDMLVAETCIMDKTLQDPALATRYAASLEPD